MAVYHMFKILLTHVVNLRGVVPVLGVGEIACANVCLGMDGCSSFFYNAVEMSCVPSLTRHYSKTGLDVVTGYMYYVMRRECEDNWTVVNGRCFYRLPTKMSKDDSQVGCSEVGANLARADSPDVDIYFRYLAQTSGYFWIDGVKQSGGKVMLQDGTLANPTRWADHEPNGDGICVQQTDRGWNDLDCSLNQRGLCEK